MDFDFFVLATAAGWAAASVMAIIFFPVKVLEAICSNNDDSNPPTVVVSSLTNDSTLSANSPIVDATGSRLPRIFGSKSPSTLVNSLTTWLPPRYQTVLLGREKLVVPVFCFLDVFVTVFLLVFAFVFFFGYFFLVVVVAPDADPGAAVVADAVTAATAG